MSRATVHRCLRCRHEWLSRSRTGYPRACARCKSTRWYFPVTEPQKRNTRARLHLKETI